MRVVAGRVCKFMRASPPPLPVRSCFESRIRIKDKTRGVKDAGLSLVEVIAVKITGPRTPRMVDATRPGIHLLFGKDEPPHTGSFHSDVPLRATRLGAGIARRADRGDAWR